MSAIELSIPSRSAYIGIARLAMATVARSCGFDEERIDELKIAVSEACTNAFLSQEEAGVDEPVTISWTERDDHVVIEVSDRGNEFDLAAAADNAQATRLSMSAALLQSLVDQFDFAPRPDGGMRARLTVARPPAPGVAPA